MRADSFDPTESRPWSRSPSQEAEAAVLRRRRERDDVYKSAEELGVELDEHIAFVAAMRPIASELGLRTRADAA